MTDYSFQSFDDMINDLKDWLKSLEDTQVSITTCKQKLIDLDEWKTLDFDFKALVVQSSKFFDTCIQEISLILQEFHQEVQSHHVSRIKNLGKSANEFNRSYGEIWHSRWDKGFHGDERFTLLEQLYQDGRDMCIDMVDISNLASRLGDFVGKKGVSLTIKPIFGIISFTLDPNLAFVLMPFTTELTQIYEGIIKSTIEESGLICQRADDLKTNKAIIEDIWQSICKARVIVADLTGLNSNVLYELGIAHTLGKETILLYQRQKEEIKFPFDLAHIRRIEYTNNVLGAKSLTNDLKHTLQFILEEKL